MPRGWLGMAALAALIVARGGAKEARATTPSLRASLAYALE